MPDDTDALLKELAGHFDAARGILQRLKQASPEGWREGIFHDSVTIPQRLLEGCRLVSSRERMLSLIPPNGVMVEVGTLRGTFARRILETCAPTKLVTIDRSYVQFDFAALQDYIDRGVLQTIEGCSWEVLSQFPDDSFDFIYIDAGHDYESVSRDLEAAASKVRKDGYIACNDYTYWSPDSARRIGVPKAVNEFVARTKFRVTHFCLHNGGFFDIVLQR